MCVVQDEGWNEFNTLPFLNGPRSLISHYCSFSFVLRYIVTSAPNASLGDLSRSPT